MSALVQSFGIILLLYFQFDQGYGESHPQSSHGDHHYHTTESSLKNFIINGMPAKPGQFPSVVSLRKRNGWHFCGGNILTEVWFITAAHCINNRTTIDGPNPFYVMAGETRLIPLETVEHLHNVTEIHGHPEYDSRTNHNDIALMKVDPPFQVDGTLIKPIELRYSSMVELGAFCKMAGWGRTTHPGESPKKSRANEPLYYIVAGITRISKARRTIEAGDPRNKTFGCNGDSGSGLICGNRLVGVLSRGQSQCATVAIYTSSYYYTEWIFDTMKVADIKSLHHIGEFRDVNRSHKHSDPFLPAFILMYILVYFINKITV